MDRPFIHGIATWRASITPVTFTIRTIFLIPRLNAFFISSLIPSFVLSFLSSFYLNLSFRLISFLPSSLLFYPALLFHAGYLSLLIFFISLPASSLPFFSSPSSSFSSLLPFHPNFLFHMCGLIVHLLDNSDYASILDMMLFSVTLKSFIRSQNTLIDNTFVDFPCYRYI